MIANNDIDFVAWRAGHDTKYKLKDPYVYREPPHTPYKDHIEAGFEDTVANRDAWNKQFDEGLNPTDGIDWNAELDKYIKQLTK